MNPILKGGQQLIDCDPLHNILFSVHMYGSWNDSQKIINKLTEVKNKQLPLIVGEFGYNNNGGKNNLGCKADHRTILKTCHQQGYGFMPRFFRGKDIMRIYIQCKYTQLCWKNIICS